MDSLRKSAALLAKHGPALAQAANVAAEIAELNRRQRSHNTAILRGLEKVQHTVEALPEGAMDYARTLADNLPAEPVRRAFAELDAETRKIRQMVLENRKRMGQQIELAQLTWIRARRSGGLRSECSGARPRAPRRKPVRRRGSRRVTGATRAGPSRSDPDPGDPSSRYARLAGRRV